jgi:DNA polymerase-4
LREIEAEVSEMARDAAAWLERRSLFTRTVVIKVRYSDFTTLTRSHSAPPTRDGDALATRAVELLHKTDAGRRPVRLLGVSVHNLQAHDEMPGGTHDRAWLATRERRRSGPGSFGGT